MKKVILSLVVFVSLATVSCKKDYNCVCTYTYLGVTQTFPTVINDTKSKAKTTCTALASSVNGVPETCSIK